MTADACSAPESPPAHEGGGRILYVVSGLPASGKTCLARAVASRLGLPMFDKDDILEALFDGPAGAGLARDLPARDLSYAQLAAKLAVRQRLSRASDGVLRALVNGSFSAVLVSFWRHPRVAEVAGAAGAGGTPTAWLQGLDQPGISLVEIHCACVPAVAQQRFAERTRHPGHCDAQRGAGGGLDFAAYAARGPLGLGTVIQVDTTGPVDLPGLVARLAAFAPAPASPLSTGD